MGYIYRYQLSDPLLRDETDLENRTEDISQIIKDHFGINFKDIQVKGSFFEFKLYESVERKFLMQMGKKLNKMWWETDLNYGFERMIQEFYVIIYPDLNGSEDWRYAEFISPEILNNYDEFSMRAKQYTQRFINNNEGLGSEKVIDNVEKAFYSDILSAYLDKNSDLMQEAIKQEADEDGVTCFLVKGYHRYRELTLNDMDDKNEKMLKFNKDVDWPYLAERKSIKPLKEHVDRMEVIEFSKQEKEIIKELSTILDLVLESAEKIEAFENITRKNNIKFKVHNVGQALATSLSISGKEPFLYFDYGIPDQINEFTKPDVIDMPTLEGTTIILSHVHHDHWGRLTEESNAYKCDWFVPDQKIKKIFNNKLAAILVAGGKVKKISIGIELGGIKLLYGAKSSISKHQHETGFALRLNLKQNDKEDVHILIAGDQRYDYIAPEYLSDLDILVASHHGGIYFASKNCEIAEPRNKENALIIYSYGMSKDGKKRNTHEHPSKTGDYKSKNWINEHHTPSDKEFEREYITL